MATLSELYITMENLHKLNLPIDERLKQNAAKLEEDLIRTEILPTLTEKIEPALAQVKRELVLVVDYVPGVPLKVSLSRKRNIADVLPDAVEIKPDHRSWVQLWLHQRKLPYPQRVRTPRMSHLLSSLL